MEVQIKKLPGDGNSNLCLISRDVYKSLRLKNETLYRIHFGQLSKECYFKVNKSKKQVCIPKNILNELVLWKGLKMNILIKGEDIFLGPIVGVFITPRFLSKLLKSNDISYKVKQHVYASLVEKCFCYYFSFEHVDLENKKVKGFTFNPILKKWVHRWFPMPNVVYDMGIIFHDEEMPLVDKVRSYFKNDPDTHLINTQKSFSKWRTYKRLSKYNEINHYIPYTEMYTGMDDVFSMLQKYKFIFLKSFYGTQGKDVLSIKQNDNRYKLNFNDRGIKELVLDDTKQLEEIVKNFINGEYFIIQQGIRLLKFNGRSLDFRVLIEKNEKGQWEAIYNHCRIAKNKLTITSQSQGGDFALYEQLYPLLKNSPYSKGYIPNNQELVDATIKIAYYIEKEFGPQGELGMDMAIDDEGKIWFIEVNARPFKDLDGTLVDLFGKAWGENAKLIKCTVPGLENPQEIFPQAISTFKYAKFLSGYNTSGKSSALE